MEITPYLNFDGRCREAFEFYAATLGGQIEGMVTYGESPMKEHSPPEAHGRIMHARLTARGAVLMGADGPPQHQKSAQGMWVAIALDDADEGRRIFDALSDRGQVAMPYAPTFWGVFGMTVDRFGIPWMINCTPKS
jgi:PhnB protein